MLVSAVVVYLRRSDKVVFPITLVAAGLFLCGADVVKLDVSGVDVEFDREVATATHGNAAAATAAAAQQARVVSTLADQLAQLTKAVAALKTSASPGSSTASPAAAAALASVHARQLGLQTDLAAVQRAQLRATSASARLDRFLAALAPAAGP